MAFGIFEDRYPTISRSIELAEGGEGPVIPSGFFIAFRHAFWGVMLLVRQEGCSQLACVRDNLGNAPSDIACKLACDRIRNEERLKRSRVPPCMLSRAAAIQRRIVIDTGFAVDGRRHVAVSIGIVAVDAGIAIVLIICGRAFNTTSGPISGH